MGRISQGSAGKRDSKEDGINLVLLKQCEPLLLSEQYDVNLASLVLM
jgi:hypothetical protein